MVLNILLTSVETFDFNIQALRENDIPASIHHTKKEGDGGIVTPLGIASFSSNSECIAKIR